MISCEGTVRHVNFLTGELNQRLLAIDNKYYDLLAQFGIKYFCVSKFLCTNKVLML